MQKTRAMTVIRVAARMSVLSRHNNADQQRGDDDLEAGGVAGASPQQQQRQRRQQQQQQQQQQAPLLGATTAGVASALSWDGRVDGASDDADHGIIFDLEQHGGGALEPAPPHSLGGDGAAAAAAWVAASAAAVGRHGGNGTAVGVGTAPPSLCGASPPIPALPPPRLSQPARSSLEGQSPPIGDFAAAWRASRGQVKNRPSLSGPPSLKMPLLLAPPCEAGDRRAAGVWFNRRDAAVIGDMLLSSWFNVLLICVPLGVAAWALRWGPIAVFGLNFFALVPLALLLGDVTEDLALRFGDVIGGLINATFGNVVEVILAIAALMKGLLTVVATSLLGSILSNLLLVLGCCFLFGGLRHQTQTFNATANQATSSLLFLSCIGTIIPTAATSLTGGDGDGAQEWILATSRGTAVVLLLIYGCYLYFQLRSHHSLFCGDGDADEDGEEGDGSGGPVLSLAASLAVLTLVTACVAGCSELLTGAIESFTERTGLSQAFVGMILLPIAGNACEHVVAVSVAMRDKMDLALGVAVGSSIQIAIFAIPLAVVVGWATGRPMSLDFDPFAVVALTVSVIHANFVTAGASSHWLMGAQLIATYVLIALTFLYR